MLVVSRKIAESLIIRPGDGADPEMTLRELFRSGPIEITIFDGGVSRVKMGVQAPPALAIQRVEPETG